jgi:hypothetical protein
VCAAPALQPLVEHASGAVWLMEKSCVKSMAWGRNCRASEQAPKKLLDEVSPGGLRLLDWHSVETVVTLRLGVNSNALSFVHSPRAPV